MIRKERKELKRLLERREMTGEGRDHRRGERTGKERYP